jgi:hypothetical protein
MHPHSNFRMYFNSKEKNISADDQDSNRCGLVEGHEDLLLDIQSYSNSKEKQ